MANNKTSYELDKALKSNGYTKTNTGYQNSTTGKTVYTDNNHWRDSGGNWKKHDNGKKAG